MCSTPICLGYHRVSVRCGTSVGIRLCGGYRDDIVHVVSGQVRGIEMECLKVNCFPYKLGLEGRCDCGTAFAHLRQTTSESFVVYFQHVCYTVDSL